MEKIKLLLVEDDESLTYMMKESLKLLKIYEVFTATNGEEGLDLYRKVFPDIIVADVEMPKMSGFEMVQEIRSTDAHTPIIFASARKSPEDFIEGLDLGADNFIRKPYLPAELNVQILALLRRVKGFSSGDSKKKDKYVLGNYLLDTQLRSLQFNGNPDTLRLTEREVNILKILLENKEDVVKRDDILIPLWGENNFYTARSLDVLMTKIRKYFKADDLVEIQTIRGEGYRLIVKNK